MPTLVRLRLLLKPVASLKRANWPEKVVEVLSQPVVRVAPVAELFVTTPMPERPPKTPLTPFRFNRLSTPGRLSCESGAPELATPNWILLPGATVVVPE